MKLRQTFYYATAILLLAILGLSSLANAQLRTPPPVDGPDVLGIVRHPLIARGDTLSIDFIGLGNTVSFQRMIIRATGNTEAAIGSTPVLVPGRYLLRAAAMSGAANAGTLPTYLGNVINWATATEVASDSLVGRPILVISLLSARDSMSNGQFSLAGTVSGNGMSVQTSRGTTTHTIPFSYSATNAILSDALGRPLRSVRVQANGAFTFSGLQVGNYSVKLESPIVSCATSIVQLSATTPTATPRFAATASGVQAVITSVGQKAKASSIQVAPNPAMGEIKLSGAKGWASIYNTLGGKVAEANSALPITISGLERGIYFIRASDAAGASQLIRLVKE